jgi:uncharacterized membrane protein YdfJ with MMPL/SSD domain
MKLSTIALAAALALGGTAFAADNQAKAPATAANPAPDGATKMQATAKQGSDARESGNTGAIASEKMTGASSTSASTDKASATGGSSGKATRHASKKIKKHSARHA